jgi:hypothetical protein
MIGFWMKKCHLHCDTSLMWQVAMVIDELMEAAALLGEHNALAIDASGPSKLKQLRAEELSMVRQAALQRSVCEGGAEAIGQQFMQLKAAVTPASKKRQGNKGLNQSARAPVRTLTQSRTAKLIEQVEQRASRGVKNLLSSLQSFSVLVSPNVLTAAKVSVHDPSQKKVAAKTAEVRDIATVKKKRSAQTSELTVMSKPKKAKVSAKPGYHARTLPSKLPACHMVTVHELVRAPLLWGWTPTRRRLVYQCCYDKPGPEYMPDRRPKHRILSDQSRQVHRRTKFSHCWIDEAPENHCPCLYRGPLARQATR